MIKKILLSFTVFITLTACGLLPLGDINKQETDDVSNTAEDLEGETTTDGTVSIETQEFEGEDPQITEDLNNIEEELLLDPNPLNLTITYDENSTVEAEIDAMGGILELTSSEGVKYTLQIPEKALMGPELIRMTLITEIIGLPLENAAKAAVKLEPTGLVFFVPVTLSISPVSIDEGQIPFGFGTMGNGENFHFQFSQENGDEMVLLLSHFSDHGIAAGSMAEINRIQDAYKPSTTNNVAASIEQAIVINASNIDNGDNFEQIAAIEDLLQIWHEKVVMLKIDEAKTDPNVLEIAVAAHLHWHQVYDVLLSTYQDVFEPLSTLVSKLDGYIEQALDGLAEAHNFAIFKAYSECVTESQPKEAFRMYRYTISAEYLDLWGRGSLNRDDVKTALDSCFSFDFVFRSEADIIAGQVVQLEKVEARVPLGLDSEVSIIDTAGGILQQKGEIVYDIHQNNKLIGLGCDLETEPGEIGVSIFFKTLNINYQEPWSSVSIDLLLDIDRVPEANYVCPASPIITRMAFWRPFFQAHVDENELMLDNGIIKISPLPVGFIPGVFAEEIFTSTHTDEPGTANMISEYLLEHKPGQ